jgi:hypothetical protein
MTLTRWARARNSDWHNEIARWDALVPATTASGHELKQWPVAAAPTSAYAHQRNDAVDHQCADVTTPAGTRPKKRENGQRDRERAAGGPHQLDGAAAVAEYAKGRASAGLALSESRRTRG